MANLLKPTAEAAKLLRPKPIIHTAESAAAMINASMKPVLEFNGAAQSPDPRQDPPAKTPLPPALARALGQS
jgi:hypothetical protein